VPKPRLTHVAFNCEQIDAMLAFYCEFAELERGLDRVDGGTRVAWLNAGTDTAPFLLVLIGRPGLQPDEPHAMEHLGFECETCAEVDEITGRARAQGVPVLEGPFELPPPVGYLVILADPCGNRVEFSCPTLTR
jgi:catechol 2,3-dioxygenase-like lactoylglutathione lyase family enzyme